jgi:hypothetical protein
MKEVLKAHNKSLTNILAKVFEVEEQLLKVSKKIEQDISNTPTGSFRNTLTEINIMLNDVIYTNFK